MGLRETVKNNALLRRIGKFINIYKAYMYDAKTFSKNYLEKADKKNHYKYSIMLLVHSLEKGMCMPNPRPFGYKKVFELIEILRIYPKECQEGFEYRLAIANLYSWKEFYEEHEWVDKIGYKEVCSFLKDKDIPSIDAGRKKYNPLPINVDLEEYEKTLLSRHSVRDFQDRELLIEDIDFALKCFREAPTACNRQMCKVYLIANPEIKEILNKFIIGISGFNKSMVNYFVITYDLSAFAYSGERQQGLFNSGLCTMNFLNGLHAKGIGSCCLQWSNKRSEDAVVRAKLKLADSERIAVVIGAGYYLEDNLIPCSARKDKDDIFKVV